MAGEAPDPKSFGSWEEAFNYPLPAVRGMERQLRRDIESNQARLRSLVGASYRDLVGTAETVIDMSRNMHKAEAYLGGIGQNCNTRMLERKGANFSNWREQVRGAETADMILASQLALLRNCPVVISRLLKRDVGFGGGQEEGDTRRGEASSLLLAAKVLVVSRLLHTKLSKAQRPPIPLLETLRDRLATLRRKLISRVERTFKVIDLANKETLIEAMCAYALATSSSHADVVRHFLHVRQRAIPENMQRQQRSNVGNNAKSKSKSVLHALRLYLATLRNVETLVIPGRLSSALSKLKKMPILRNPDLMALADLDLEVHGVLVGDELSSFTPYIRHDDLGKSEAESLLKAWARSTMRDFIADLSSLIKSFDEPLDIVGLRTDVIEAWLAQPSNRSGVDLGEVLDSLRDLFNAQAIRLIEARAGQLNDVGVLSVQITENQDIAKPRNDASEFIWDLPSISLDADGGVAKLKQTLTDKLSGTTGPLQAILDRHRGWLDSIAGLEGMIAKIREKKWDEYKDDAEEADDDLLDDKQVLLGEDDPRILTEKLSECLNMTYMDLESRLDPVSTIISTSPSSGQKAVLLLRIWRQIRQGVPDSYKVTKLGLDSITRLQHLLAQRALDRPLSVCSKRLSRWFQSLSLVTRPLWEGDGVELPTSPSPWAFRLLLDVQRAMELYGADIWSPGQADSLKILLDRRLSGLLENVEKKEKMDSNLGTGLLSNGHVNGDASPKVEGDIAEAADPKTSTTQDVKDSALDNDPPTANDEMLSSPKGDDEETDKKNDGVVKSIESPNRQRTESQSRDFLIQQFFDTLFLTQAIAVTTIADLRPSSSKTVPSSEKDEEESLRLSDTVAALESRIDLDDAAVKRMRRDAEGYWKRTRLLCGLL